MKSNFDNSSGASKQLITKFRGSYEVVKLLSEDRYVVNDITGYQNAQIPYEGIIDSNRMKPFNS